MNKYRIASIPGDGIGLEVVAESIKVLDVVSAECGFKLDYTSYDYSCEYYAKNGKMMPDDGLDRLRDSDGIFLGAVGFPGVPDHISLWGLLIPIRRAFQQYINLRPVKLMQGINSPLKNPGEIDFYIVRENNEGEYSSIGGMLYEGTELEMAMQQSVFTRKGVDRVLKYAFDLAQTRKKTLVGATKSNGIVHTMPFWDKRFAEMEKQYPEIATAQYHIDILCAHFITRPSSFDVVVASNLFGDILSDIGPAVVGGMGIAPGANINPERLFPSMFEPVHGSAPDIAGKNIANPIASIWTASMMLDHLGEKEGAALILKAIEAVVLEGTALTPDLGGKAQTKDVTQAIIKKVEIRKAMKYIASKLIYFVLFSIVLGIFIGHFFPEIALKQVMDNSWKANFFGHELKVGNTLSEWCSGVFISTMKLFINPIIFLTTALGVIQMGDVKKVGKLGAKALLYFEVITTGALLIGVFVAWIIQPGKGVLRNISQANVSNYVNDAKGFTWVEMLSTNTTLQIIIGAILIGILVTKSKALSPLTGIMTKVSNTLFKWLFFLMLFAPLGAFGGMAYTIAKYGLGSIVLLAKLMATVYITMGLFIFVVLGLMLRQYKISIFKVLAYFKEELLIVLGTSSSEPVLPQLMVKLERMGCAKSVVGLVVPTGYSFNTDGSTIYMSMAVIFLAQVFEIHLSFEQIITIIGVLMITTKGSAGVTGLGFIALASTLAAIKIIPIEGLAILLGVDRFMSEARAITNFTGNAVAAIWLANNENAFDRDAMNQALNV